MTTRIHNYIHQRNEKERELESKIGGDKGFGEFAKTHPYSLVRLSWECLSRVQQLPAFPKQWFKRSPHNPQERFVREYVELTLAHANEVASAGPSGDRLAFLLKTFELVEWSLQVGQPSTKSPLFWGAHNFNHAIRWLCGNNLNAFTNFILKPICSAIVLGLAESAAFSKSLEDFVLVEVARIKAEKAEDLGSLEGATLPQVARASQTEQARALIDQLSGLMDSNPSVLEELWPPLSELTQQVAETLVKTHPEQVSQFHEELARMIEPYRTPSKESSLNIRQAAERIGISTGRVHQLYKEKRLGTEVDGNPRFSEFECDEYRERERKPGRPKKGDDAS